MTSVKVVKRRRFKNKAAFHAAIRRHLTKVGEADEMEIAVALRSGLLDVCKAIRELRDAGKVAPAVVRKTQDSRGTK